MRFRPRGSKPISTCRETPAVDNLLERRIAKHPPTTQRDACRLAVRQSIAALGVCEPRLLRATALGLAQGLFGPAFDAADAHQKQTWINMMADEYRAATQNTG